MLAGRLALLFAPCWLLYLREGTRRIARPRSSSNVFRDEANVSDIQPLDRQAFVKEIYLTKGVRPFARSARSFTCWGNGGLDHVGGPIGAASRSLRAFRYARSAKSCTALACLSSRDICLR